MKEQRRGDGLEISMETVGGGGRPVRSRWVVQGQASVSVVKGPGHSRVDLSTCGLITTCTVI